MSGVKKPSLINPKRQGSTLKDITWTHSRLSSQHAFSFSEKCHCTFYCEREEGKALKMFILHFTSQDTFIWSKTSSFSKGLNNPPCVDGDICHLSVVLDLQYTVRHFLSQSVKTERGTSCDSGRLVNLSSSHLVWMLDNGERERVIYKSLEGVKFPQLLLKVLTLELAARRSSLEAELETAEGLMKHGRRPHCALSFLFGHLNFTPLYISAQHSGSPTFPRLSFIQSSSWQSFKLTSLCWCDAFFFLSPLSNAMTETFCNWWNLHRTRWMEV